VSAHIAVTPKHVIARPFPAQAGSRLYYCLEHDINVCHDNVTYMAASLYWQGLTMHVFGVTALWAYTSVRYVSLFVCFWRDSPQWARDPSFRRYLDHT